MTMMTILVMKIFIMKFYFQRTVFVGVGNGLIHGHTIHLGKKPVQLKKKVLQIQTTVYYHSKLFSCHIIYR